MSARTQIVRGNVLAALCCALLSSCGSEPKKAPPPERPKPKPAAVKPKAGPAPSSTPLHEPSPAAVLEKMRARVRLTPDARFLAAIVRADRFAAQAGLVPVVRFGEGAWHVQIGQDVIGVLPELPGFADQYAMVLARAKRAWKTLNPEAEQEPEAEPKPSAEPDAPAAEDGAQHAKDGGAQGGAGGANGAADAGTRDAPAAPPQLDELAPIADEGALLLLANIDQAWSKGERNPDDARRAAQAYVALCLATIDAVDTADALYAQALATVALAEAASGQPMAREKAVLAHLLGHGQGARAIAETLPKDHAARRFVEGDTAALVARGKNAAADGFTRLLALRALLAHAPASEVAAFIAAAPDELPASFAAEYTASNAARGGGGALRAAYAALIPLRAAVGRPVELPAELRRGATGLSEQADAHSLAAAAGVPEDQVVAAAEKLLTELGTKGGGSVLPADARVAYHRAQLFSAFDALVTDVVAAPVAGEAARLPAQFAANQGPLAQQWSRYAGSITAAIDRGGSLDDVVKNVRELRELGLGAVRRTFGSISTQRRFGAAEQPALAALVEHCDTRVACRALLSDIAHFNLEDPVTDELLRTSVAAEAPHDYTQVRLRHLRMTRDRAGFIAAMADRALAPELRAGHLARWAEWLDALDVRRAFDALIAEVPANSIATGEYAHWLIEHGDAARALRLTDDWLRKDKRQDASERSAVRTARALALHRAGRSKEAWAEVEPLLASHHGGALEVAAYVKSAGGDAERAIALARELLAQHPDPKSVGLLAQILWTAGRHDEAAALLAERAPKPGDGAFWSMALAGAFAQAFAARPADDGAQACSALLAKNVDKDGVRRFIRALKVTPELAFRCHSLLQDSGPAHDRDVVQSYLYLKAWKDEAAAREWIAQAVAEPARAALAEPAFFAGAHELVWDFVADPQPADAQAPSIWLMRTASLVQSGAAPAEWRPRLDRYYARHREQVRDRMALHLLGEMDQVAVWSAVRDDRDRAACAYVLGLKAELGGDIAQAADWYRAALEGTPAGGETAWSADALARLRDEGKSIALLAQEAAAKKSPEPATENSAEPAAEGERGAAKPSRGRSKRASAKAAADAGAAP